MLASKTMLNLMRVLLCSEKARSIRELAKEAEVTLSRAAREINRLHLAGYISKRPHVRVERRADLLMAFSYCWSVRSVPFESYESVERPEYIMTVIGELASDHGLAYGFTLLSGAELLSPYVVPSSVHLYIEGDQLKIWRQVLRDKGIHLTGSRSMRDVNLLMWDNAVFYRLNEVRGLNVVSPYQVFADLHGMGGIMRNAAMQLAKRMEWGIG